MREWFKSAMPMYPMISRQFITSLKSLGDEGAEERMKYDFDLQVKVLQIVRLDRYSAEMRVIDESGQLWHCQVLN